LRVGCSDYMVKALTVVDLVCLLTTR
jgi:hypothetical protein